MANKQYLNYDPDTNQLYLCDNCETNPVYTKTSFNEDSLSVRDDDCLYMKDVDGQVHKISNSLRGPAGTDGKDGKDGEKGADGLDALLPHHLELSNDFDQVYVNANNVVEITQTITTDVTLYLGDDVISFYTDYDKSEGTKIWKLYDGEPKSDDSNLVNGNKIEFEFTEGQKVEDPIFVKQIYAVLEINNLKSREIIKDFKIKRLQGTEDYDLWVSPAILKITSDTELDKSAQINVKIKKRTLGLTSSVSYITDLSEKGLPAGLAVKYKFNNGKEQVVPDDGIIQIDDTSTLDLTNKYTISLYRNGDELIDQAIIECVKDGRDGEISKHIELSDEWDQVYITEGKTKRKQEYNLTASYYEGSVKKSITDTIDLFSGSLAQYVYNTKINDGSVKFDIIIPDNTPLSPGQTQKLTFTYNDAKQDFTLITLEGKYDYDLVVTPGNMSLPAENYEFEDIIIKIRRKEIGANPSESEFVSCPNGYSLSATIDGENANEYLDESKGIQSCISGQTLALGKPKIVTITLLKGNTIIDSSEVAILYDGGQGPQGPQGKDGASAYFLDFSNDYDLIYYSNEEPNKQVYSSTIENIITLYKGSEILTLPKGTTAVSITSNIDESTPDYIKWDVVDGKVKLTFNISNDSISVNKTKDLKSITYNINIQATVIDNELEENINITKLFKLAVIEGDEDFDLQVSRTTIRKDGSGYLIDKTPIDVEVWYRLFTGTHTKHAPVENLAWLYEKGLSLKYSIDGGTPTDLLVIEQIDTDIQQAAENYVMLYLTKGQDVIDYIRLDVARDGTPGKDASGWALDLSNDTDQLLHQEGVTGWQLTISTEIRLFKETKLLAANDYTIEPIYPDSVDEAWCTLTSMDTYYLFTMDVPEGTEIISGLSQMQILFMVTVNEEDINLNKYLNIHVIQGTDDFDLLLSKYSIKSSGSQIVDVGGLEVWVRKTTRLGESISKTNLYGSGVLDLDHWVDSGLSINATAYKGSDSLLCGINDNGIVDTSNISEYDRIVITLKLNGEWIDEETVQIVRDGSSYYLELENEYDLVSIQNSKVFGNQTLSVGDVTLYNGGSIIDDFSIEWSETGSDGVTLNTNGKSASITYLNGTNLNSDSTYTLIAKVNGSQVATAKFTVIAVAGSILYDLDINKTVFNKDSNGNLKDDGKLEVEVIKTDLKTSSVRTLSVSEWLDENIQVRISIDGGETHNIQKKDYPVENINKEAVVSLLHNEKLVDQVRIEVVSDGYTPEITQKPNGVIEIKSSPTTDPVTLNPDIRYVTLAFSFADNIDNVDSRWAIYAGDQYDQASMGKVMPYPEDGIDSSAIYVFRQDIVIPFYYIRVNRDPALFIYDYDGQHDSWKTLFEYIILDEVKNKFPDNWNGDGLMTSEFLLDVSTSSKSPSEMKHVIEHESFPLVTPNVQNIPHNATILKILRTEEAGCFVDYIHNVDFSKKQKQLPTLTLMLTPAEFNSEITYTDSLNTSYKVTPSNIGIFKNLQDLIEQKESYDIEIGVGSGVLSGFQGLNGGLWLNLKELNKLTQYWKSQVG